MPRTKKIARVRASEERTRRALPANAKAFRRRLLGWYGRHQRPLPWRRTRDPYRIVVSEFMLQQTQVSRVAEYYPRFLARFPTVHHLARAKPKAVREAWEGLGYYARARNLHRCARVVVEQHGGVFPDTESKLRELPGIGTYTAAAIAAIAFGRHATPVDGNIERVTARLFAVADPLPGSKPELRRLAATLTPKKRAGDFAQAMMDLGSAICIVAKPKCLVCPIAGNCRARAAGIAAELPARSPKRARPLRRGVVFWAVRRDGSVLLRRRPEEGLLGGMMEFPSTAWRAKPWKADEALAEAPVDATWEALPGLVRHGFTHFELELKVFTGRAKAKEPGVWCPIDRLSEMALPSLMKKVASFALKKSD